jgi:GTP-binding protein
MTERAFGKPKFLLSARDARSLPKNALPEIALAGRSNVGKSSFLNAFFRAPGVAKVSAAPGKTRAVNYFVVDDRFHVVDLPGFGYAKVSHKERDLWAKFIGDYYATPRPRLTIHLIDSRHSLQSLDADFRVWLAEHGRPSLVALTKSDKLKQKDRARVERDVLASLPDEVAKEDVFLVSSVKKTGFREIEKRLVRWLEEESDERKRTRRL